MQNILDVVIPEILFQRIPTGIQWLDSTLTQEGGLVPSLHYMLSGRPGAGKSTLVRQLADGITKNEGIVFYNSGEESKEQIAIAVQRMCLQNGFIVSNETCHVKLFESLKRLQVLYPDKKIVLIQDSLQKLTTSCSVVAAGRALKEWAKETNHTVISVCQVTKKGEFKGSNDILHDVDVHLEFLYDKKSGNRSFVVSKNRFGPVTDEDGIAYVITDKGLDLRYDAEDLDDEFEDEDVEEDKVTFTRRMMVFCNRNAAPKHRKKVGKIKKVGRTRLTVVTEKGEELYLPLEHFSPV